MPKSLLVLLLLFVGLHNTAQEKIKVGSILKTNDIVAFQNQNIILIDFWATWCGPCIPAAEQLEVYQKQLKDEVYMIGMSDESTYTISKFLKKKKLDLAIYQDYNAENVTKYDIPYRPYSIVLSPKGKVLWEGSPTNLNVTKLKNLAKKIKKQKYQLSDVFQYIKPLVKKDNLTSADTLDIYVQHRKHNGVINDFNISKHRVYFEGTIENFYSHLYNIPTTNIFVEKDVYIKFSAKKDIWIQDRKRVIKEVNSKLQYQTEISQELVDAHEVKIIDPSLLWDDKQVNWGEQTNTYLIGEDRIEADNLSINEICTLLSQTKSVNYFSTIKEDKKYDWNFHYKFNNLMKEELLYQFGIEIMPLAKSEIQILNIKKRQS